ncbi:MAG TPA: energy-coupling factor transporter transmembrane component T [Candidatus Limnocylindrales bacterium]|nr:energy-coupling factor transporter transmembrane component T [Candidatus Limnocylindrales bacterium]
MLTPVDLTRAQSASLLGRASPIVKLGLALVWLVALAFTTDPVPPLVLAAIAVAAGLGLGRIPERQLWRALAPLLVAAASIGVANLLFSGSNADPSATELVRLGPFRLTREAAETAAGLAARVLAIVAVGAVFAQSTDPTRLVDALVHQGRVPDRFAYGALAAYQAVPRLAGDLATIRQARRIRGLGDRPHPRLLVALLVRAIRHADQLALAMDARAFGSGPRTSYRPIRWGWADLVVAAGGLAALWFALALGG